MNTTTTMQRESS